MLTRCFLVLMLAISANALADASAGEFMGYRLGDRYPPGPDTPQQLTTTGNLILTAGQPVKPDDIAEVTLLATPMTRTVGSITASQWFPTEEQARAFARRYFELLRARYPAWSLDQDAMDARMNIVEVGFREIPHSLRLRLTPESRGGADMWRFSMTLDWSPDSEKALAWRKLATAEQAAARKKATEQKLENADLRGL